MTDAATAAAAAPSAAALVAPAGGAPITAPAAGTVTNTGDTSTGTTAVTQGVALEWLPGIETEVSTYIAGKGFKDPQSLAKSYMNLERNMSSRPFEVPKADDADSWGKIRAAAGVPETADKYDLGELAAKINPEGAKPWLELFHKEGISSKTAQTLLGSVMQSAQQQEQAREVQFTQKSEKETGETLTAWGERADTFTDLSKRGIAKMSEGLQEFGGLNADELKGIERALGARKLMEFGLWLGRQTVEAGLVPRDGQNVNMSREQASSAVEQFKRDAGKAAILNDKRHPQHDAVKREWQALLNVAFG